MRRLLSNNVFQCVAFVVVYSGVVAFCILR